MDCRAVRLYLYNSFGNLEWERRVSINHFHDRRVY
jgi:hypothetical protein